MGWQERAELRAAQQGKCAICDEPLGRDAEVDHILALENLGTNAKENLQICCRACHQEKSQEEAYRGTDPLLSYFCPLLYDSYVKSPKRLPLVLENTPPPAQELYLMDVKRCRFNAFFEAACPIPVFSALDSIEARRTEHLGDLNYIDAGIPKTPAQLLGMLPYQGPGWVTRGCA